ncbi:putative uncharacterized protein [Bacteroides eggerthii CAG:109]|nr:putative uncharacterized protein [Bacteroides eggerthii CAG:109]
MKGSLIIIGFFVLGTLCGVSHLIPIDIVMDSRISFYALCALMFSVGLSVGNDPQTLKNFRSLNPRLVFLPIMTILGTLAGSAAGSLIPGSSQPHPDSPLADRLPGSRFGLRILFTLQHLHHRIQRSRTGNHCTACQYQPRDTHLIGCTVAGALVR